MNRNQAVNRLFLLATAPFLGMMLWMFSVQMDQLMPPLQEWKNWEKPDYTPPEHTAATASGLELALEDASSIRSNVEKYYELYTKSADEVSVMLQQAAAAVKLPSYIFERRIVNHFGSPIKHISSPNIDLKLYSFKERNYKGYALKAELKTDKAMDMAFAAGDKLGRSETTLGAVSRLGGIAGINAGGFTPDNGKIYPIGNTIVNGKYVYGFFPKEDLKDLVFVGLDQNRKLIGGQFSEQKQLDALNPRFGASFVPILIRDGRKMTIPSKWVTSPYRAARTVVGSFKNDQLLFIVSDGKDASSTSGASLAELQDKLYQLGIRDAYNLDGGGSSTLVWGEQVINQPSDGRMRSMPTHFVFFK